MSKKHTLLFPSNSKNWNNVFNCINRILRDYEINVSNISDVIYVLREIRNTYDGPRNNLYYNDAFLGLGLFMQNLKNEELQLFVEKSIRNILFYCQMIGQLDKNFENELLFQNDVAKVSILSAKCLLACSILCLLPQQRMDSGVESQDAWISINIEQLYAAIIHGSKNHIALLKSILNYFVKDPATSIDDERQSFITVTIANCDQSPFTTSEPLHSWPIVLVSKTTLTDIPLPNSINLWPMYFPRISPSNLFSCSNLQSELPIYSNLPVLIPLLPLLTMSVSENIGAVNVKWKEFSCSIQKVHFIDSWNRQCQYSKESIVENIAHCLLAIKISQKDYQLCDTNFANEFTQSIIEDVIQKLNSKTSPLTFGNGTSSYVDPLKQARSSLTSNVFRGSREGSITGNSVPRSARHSYSASSSSRSGSLQLSSLSSRRSSSNTSSSQNKDTEYPNAPGDKVDYSVHAFQPVIVEESGNHADDEEAPSKPMDVCEEFGEELTPLEKLMSSSICDSTKMSMSKDLLNDAPQIGAVESVSIRRRNSSPLLRPSFQIGDGDSQLLFEQKQLFNRCCEEDANNDHLIRLNNLNRRQSLPCHLQWLYQLPLTDTVKVNLSNSRSFVDNADMPSMTATDDESADDYFDGRIIFDSKNTLSKLVTFADRLLRDISLNGDRNIQQQSLRREILNKRQLLETVGLDDDRDRLSVSTDDQLTVLCDEHSLLSLGDLATFDRVLNSSSFFDNEAIQLFSKLSTMSSPSSVWTPHEEIFLVDTDTAVVTKATTRLCPNHRKPASNTSTIVDYVNQLTTSIITDAMDHNYGSVQSIPNRRSSCDVCLEDFAERISLEVITGSLVQMSINDKKAFDSGHWSPIYARSFPIEYDRQLTVLMQMIAGAISQRQTGHSHVMVFDQVSVEMEEIFLLLSTEKIKCNPEKVLKAIMAIIKESGTVSISSLISYLMHNY